MEDKITARGEYLRKIKQFFEYPRFLLFAKPFGLNYYKKLQQSNNYGTKTN